MYQTPQGHESMTFESLPYLSPRGSGRDREVRGPATERRHDMSRLPTHPLNTAPEQTRPALEKSQRRSGALLATHARTAISPVVPFPRTA